MSNLNKAQLIGRLGRDPEMRGQVCKLSIATSYKPRDGDEQTEWHRVTCFGKLAELADRYLTRGRLVYVEGRLHTSSYDKDGQKHYSTEIIAHDVKFLGGKGDGAGKRDDGPAPYDDSAQYMPAGPEDDDVPF